MNRKNDADKAQNSNFEQAISDIISGFNKLRESLPGESSAGICMHVAHQTWSQISSQEFNHNLEMNRRNCIPSGENQTKRGTLQ